MPGRRLFVAVPLPAWSVEEISALVERVRDDGSEAGGQPSSHRRRGVRWVRLDGLNLTLRFLGPTLEPAVPPVVEAVRTVAREASPFRIVVGGGGAFPDPSRPRALWLGVRAGGDELGALASGLDAALATVGWPPTDRPFRPHLTLARSDGIAAGPATARRLIEAGKEVDLAFDADRIVLFESRTGGGPARYEPVESVLLGPAPAPPDA
jgi:2'-5' RNA ligase